MEIHGIVYLYENKVNGKKYVGQTTQSLGSRHRQHLANARYERRSMPFHQAIRKYGIDMFVNSVLAVASSQTGLDELESYFIQLFETTDRNKGYNRTAGGANGKRTEDVKSKISQSTKQYWSGPEGIKKRALQYKPITGTNLYTGEICQYKSLHAAKVDGFSPSAICNVLKGNQKRHKDFTWRYA